MNWPEKLSKVDMGVALSEWRLAGLHVVVRDQPFLTTEIDPHTFNRYVKEIASQIVVGEQAPSASVMFWAWLTRYDLEDGVWVLKIKEQRNYLPQNNR